MQASKAILLSWMCLTFVIACKKEAPIAPASPQTLVLPEHFPQSIYSIGAFSPDARKVAIGRRLFYDPILSLDSTIHCGSCHKQQEGFADQGAAVSTGIFGRTGLRNSPTLANLIWKPLYMMDGGVLSLDLQPIAPITDSHEMGLPLADLVNRLKQNTSYSDAFNSAFDEDNINSQKILVCLAQFMATMISSNSPFDRYILGNSSALSSQEKQGLDVFQRHCASCHSGVITSDFSFRHNGLAPNASDSGRQRITGLESDRGKFMVPTLRNISRTSPYMHDGRFSSLEEVLLHYSQPANPALADELIGNGISLSASEQVSIIAFLNALEDPYFLNNLDLGPPTE